MSEQCERFLYNLPTSALAELSEKFAREGGDDGLPVEVFIPTILSSLPPAISKDPNAVSDLREIRNEHGIPGT